MYDFSPWDIADIFRLHVAACLIAGVMPLSKRFPDADEIPAAAKPVLVKLSMGYYFGTMLNASEAIDSPQNPKEKWLFGIAADPCDVNLVWKHPRGAIRKGGTTLDMGATIVSYLKHAMVSRSELHRWLTATGIKSAYSFAPVVISLESTPDPERRLSLLRSLGGTAKYIRSEWKFTGIKALVDSEKSDGRKRCDEKTIRDDLKEAAQNERDAKRAGFSDGLGQR